MKVEVWSDVMCPFCYIGKRKFEKALSEFPAKEEIEVEWKSFQLNPSLKTQPGKNVTEYLAEIKGWTLAYAKQMNDHVTQMAKEVGLEYHFDKAIVANSFDAHRLLQYAKTQGKGDELEERLFKAYFTEGKNTADHATLLQLATDIGLNSQEASNVLSSDQYKEEVLRDIYEARQVGASGVPFFVIDQKYAVSGAQAPETFLRALTKSWEEHENKKPTKLDTGNNDNVCTDEGCAL
ncbi:MAG TPA: DsbA family oxidoreductase [Cytophagaceae bacterium]|nr:DsbA family oxidoreductase [Cytophagaceae bacterium]